MTSFNDFALSENDHLYMRYVTMAVLAIYAAV